MATTSLAKLQCTVDKLSKENLDLRDRLAKSEAENKELKAKIRYLEKTMEDKINKAVNEAVSKVTEHYEKIIKEKDQRIFELECRLNINSETSSLPSSKDPIDKEKKKSTIANSREDTEKNVGGQPNHPKHKLEKFKDDEITETIEHIHDECSNCHSKNLTVVETKERDEIDFKVIIKKIRHKFRTQKCNDCGASLKQEIPENLHADNQYGSNTKAFILMLYN